MNDMISRADAAAICDKHSYSNNPYVSMRMMDAAREIRALPAVEVGIKPLEWFEGDEPDEWRSGPYDVWCELGKHQVYHWSIVMGEPHETAEAAKAAAQADYDARIRSALTATPSADVAGLRNICRSMPDIPGLHETYQPRNIAAALDGYICALARMKEAGE